MRHHLLRHLFLRLLCCARHNLADGVVDKEIPRPVPPHQIVDEADCDEILETHIEMHEHSGECWSSCPGTAAAMHDSIVSVQKDRMRKVVFSCIFAQPLDSADDAGFLSNLDLVEAIQNSQADPGSA